MMRMLQLLPLLAAQLLLLLPSGGATNISLGLHSTYANEPRNGPAVRIALDAFRAQGRLTDVNFTIVLRYFGCSPYGIIKGVGQAIQLVQDEHVDMIFGPICSTLCIPSAYALTYWNIPYFPAACTSPTLGDKSIFKTTVRTAPIANKLGAVVAEIVMHYGWRRVVLVTNGYDSVCEYGSRGIEQALRAANVTLAEWIKVPVSPSDDTLRRFLQGVAGRGRIVILCTERAKLVRFMLLAHEMGMTSSEYVYLFYQLIPDGFTDKPWEYGGPHTLEELARRKQAFYPFKTVGMADMSVEKVAHFMEHILSRVHEAPFHLNRTDIRPPSLYSMFLHDSTLLYLDILEEMLQTGEDYKDGLLVFQKAANRTISVGTVTGTVAMDANAERNPDFELFSLRPGQETFSAFAAVKTSHPRGSQLKVTASPYWGTADGTVPPDTPTCGLQGEHCKTDDLTIGVSTVVSVAVVLMGVGVVVIIYRRRREENELQQMLWRVRYDDLDFAKIGFDSRALQSMKSLASMEMGDASMAISHGTSRTITLAIYKGNSVAVYHSCRTTVQLTRDFLLDMKHMRELRHDNLVQFVGACVDPPNVCYLLALCSKGSLQDILENDDIKLDWMFKTSLINDLVNGMCYLHGSTIVSHGRLKSDNCLVDSRWVLKVSGHGMTALHSATQEDVGEYQKAREKVWTAPELLRLGDTAPPNGSQHSDVYSFAIILQEVLYRTMPFMGRADPLDIVERVMAGETPPFRPEVKTDTLSPANSSVPSLTLLMETCWSENPELRPPFGDIRRKLRYINKGRSTNILDRMVKQLEQYATNLEEIVQQRTSELVDEKKKTDKLLYRMLPKTVAEQLKRGQTLDAEIFESVTIYFSDIVAFTSLASQSSPMEIVNLLNDLYTMFDDIIAQYDVYKVETIGDAYMVSGGLPWRTPNHVTDIVEMALHLLSDITAFRIRHRPGHSLRVRIGIHTGSCAAGVVGFTMPRYCLFGDTVNIASRMESHGFPNTIHMSQESRDALRQFSGYHITPRGLNEIKGKGLLHTYFLTGRDGLDRRLPPLEIPS